MRPSASILIRIAVGCFAFYGTTGCNDRAASDRAELAPSDNVSGDRMSTRLSGRKDRGAISSDRITGVQSDGGVDVRKAPIPLNSLDSRAYPEDGGGEIEKGSRQLLDETWFVITIDGKKVGYRSVVRGSLQRDGQTIHETTGREHLTLVREGREAVVDFDCIDRETATGTFLEAEYRLPFGLNSGWTVATVDRQRLRIGPKTGRGRETFEPWPPDAGGPFAITKSLRTRPMDPGENRAPKYFDASIGKVITASLRATEWESTDLLEGETRLLRIDVRTRLPSGAELTSTLWTDDQGTVWKESQMVGVKVVAYRTSKETALAADDSQPLDIFRRVLVPIDPPIASPYDHGTITYEITAPEGDPSKLFVGDSRQMVHILGQHQIELVVGSVLPSGDDSTGDRPEKTTGRQEPKEVDLASSPLIQCDHPDIEDLASSVAAGKTNVATIAVALEKLVFDRIEEKSYGKVFASATEVASSREGDCTEHSVLLVAVCRARKIPARAAMGLVYSEAHLAFAYHMWTEVWTGDSWLGLDATLGRGRIGPTHLKMSESSLEGPAALAEMATILQAVGALEINVVAR